MPDAKLKRAEELRWELLNPLTNADGEPRYVLFLGAGASKSSRIPLAAAMNLDFRRTLRKKWTQAGKPTGKFERWLHNRPGWLENREAGEYSQLITCLYDNPADRDDEIQRYMDRGTPSWGYYCLAQILSKRVFSTVITTNFDDLISDACSQYSPLRPRIYSMGDQRVPVVRQDRTTVLKLHGDYVYRKTANNGYEMKLAAAEPRMRASIEGQLANHHVVVIGYSGGNETANAFLHNVPESYAVYWCTLRNESPDNGRVKDELESTSNWWKVETGGFDQFMDELYYDLIRNAGLTLNTVRPDENEMLKIIDMIEAAESPHRQYYIDSLLKTVGSPKHVAALANRMRGRTKATGARVKFEFDKAVGFSGSLKEEERTIRDWMDLGTGYGGNNLYQDALMLQTKLIPSLTRTHKRKMFSGTSERYSQT